MNSIINIKNQGGNLVVSSREVAENFEKRHDGVLRDIENLISSIGTPQNCGMLFIESEYVNSNNRRFKEYLLTRDGFSLLVMGFTGQKALEWKLKYIDAFNKMEQAIKNNKLLTPIEELKLHYQVLETHEEKITEINNRVNTLENNMVVDYGQAVTIKKTVDKKVISVLYGFESPAYLDMQLRKKVYSAIWKDYKGYFNITSYHNTLKKDFSTSLSLIRSWVPSGALLREIEQANRQIAM